MNLALRERLKVVTVHEEAIEILRVIQSEPMIQPILEKLEKSDLRVLAGAIGIAAPKFKATHAELVALILCALPLVRRRVILIEETKWPK